MDENISLQGGRADLAGTALCALGVAALILVLILVLAVVLVLILAVSPSRPRSRHRSHSRPCLPIFA